MSPPKSLRHLNKNRVQTPTRRPPTIKHAGAEDVPDGPGEHMVSRTDRSPALNIPELKQVGEEIIV